MRKPSSSTKTRKFRGPKSILISLVLQLEGIAHQVYDVEYEDLWFRHSHQSQNQFLSPLLQCVLLIEDRRFFKHYGFELRAVARGLKYFLRKGRIGGVSTIDQQVVRIARSQYERTFSRKLSEVILSLLLQFHCSKSQLLQYYIHNAYLGYGLEGCETASRVIFRKDAYNLVPDEAALIASLFARPMKYSAVTEIKRIGHGPISVGVIMNKVQVADNDYFEVLNARYQHTRRLFASLPNSRLIR